LWGFGKYILEPFFTEVVKSNSDEIFIGSVLFLVMGASLLAHTLGFSYSLGAFIAGMIIAETRYKHQVEADLIPFRDLLLGIFFITVGMQINFEIVMEYAGTIMGLFLLFTLVKMSILFILLYRFTTKRIALKTALALFQLGEFGLVAFELANAQSLVDPLITQVLIVTIILSMILTPFVLRHISFLANILLADEEVEKIHPKKHRQKEHIVILGYGRLGREICGQLETQGIHYIAIENNIQTVISAQKEGKNVIFGNAAKKTILESINIEDAITVIVAFDNSEKLHLVCEILHNMHLDARIILKADRFKQKEALQQEFPHYEIVVGTEEVAHGIINSTLRCEL